jgi:hypothetical protein
VVDDNQKIEPNVVERLCEEDYQLIKKVACPFCAVNLPERYVAARQNFIHHIPRTQLEYPCDAIELRLARGCVKLALQNLGATGSEE